MTRGRKKKQENVGDPLQSHMNNSGASFPSPDQWNKREELINQFNELQQLKPPVESSVPIGELSFKTEGLQPRTRTAFTRAADDRINHYIDYFSRKTTEEFKGQTYMPEECIPKGYKFMWGRRSVQGRPDDNAMRKLERKGWEIAHPENYPGYAFYDDNGNVNDSSGTIAMGGLIGMQRDERIHEAELKYFERQRQAVSREYADLKSSNPNVDPRSRSQIERYNDQFFPSTEASRSSITGFE